MYWLLLVILFGLTVGIFFLFKKDVLSPSFIFAAMCTVSILAAIIARGFWNDVEIGIPVMFFPIIAVIATACGEMVIRWLMGILKNKKGKGEIKKIETNANVLPVFKCPGILVAAIYLFIIVTFVVIVVEMINITGISNNIPEMINSYRNLTPLFNANDSTVSIGTFATQLMRISDILGMIFLFVFINNTVKGGKVRDNAAYIGITILSTIIMLFVAGRSSLVQYVLFGLGMFILLRLNTFEKKENKENKKNKRRAGILFGGIIAAATAFYLIMPLIGRVQIGGPINYISFYVGNPIPSFQKLVDTGGLEHSEYFGQETLKNARGILDKIGFQADFSAYQDTWVPFSLKEGDGVMMSNTFSGMKPYYSDWGVVGVVICQFLFGLFFGFLYYLAKNRRSIFIYLLWGMLLVNVFTQVSNERLFSCISVSMIVYIIYLSVIQALLFSRKKGMLRITAKE